MIKIKTYQDLLAIGDNETKRKDFVHALINEHKTTKDYKIAKDAYEYFCHRNVTIGDYQRILTTIEGQHIIDTSASNYKMASNHLYRFITQEVQYLLGNGITWGKEDTDERLGKGKWSIDRQIQDAATKALWGKVAFGFYDKDHVEVFSYLEYIPLFDEMDGSMKAGVRFWQIDESKPLRATLYEIDGFTKYVWNADKDAPKQDEPKRAYLQKVATTEADGDMIVDEENYPAFPITPLWANS